MNLYKSEPNLLPQNHEDLVQKYPSHFSFESHSRVENFFMACGVGSHALPLLQPSSLYIRIICNTNDVHNREVHDDTYQKSNVLS